jgi:hypothetical protein
MEVANLIEKEVGEEVSPTQDCWLKPLLLIGFEFDVVSDVNVFQCEGDHAG